VPDPHPLQYRAEPRVPIARRPILRTAIAVIILLLLLLWLAAYLGAFARPYPPRPPTWVPASTQVAPKSNWETGQTSEISGVWPLTS